MNDFLDGLDLEKEIKVGCLASILVEQLNKKLYGEVLTIIDAVGKDAASTKAIKALISQSFTRNTRQLVLNINALPKKQA
jgi:predicted metal-dependent enzyme (double-stranded beta helix superfamily)